MTVTRRPVSASVLALAVVGLVVATFAVSRARGERSDEEVARLQAAIAGAQRLEADGRTDEAADAFEQVAEAALAAEREDLAAWALEHRFACLVPGRRYAELLRTGRRLLALTERAGEPAQVLRAQVNLGGVLVELGRYDEGVVLLHDAIGGLEDADPAAAAHTLTTLAIAEAARGRFGDALGAVERARDLAIGAEDDEVVEYVDVVEASLLSEIGEYGWSLSVLERRLDRIPEDAPGRRAQVLSNVARNLAALGRDADALDAYAEAFDLARRAGDELLRAWAHLGRAELYRRAGRHEQALADCRAAASVAAEHPFLLGFARTGTGASLLLRSPPDLDGAALAYEEAGAIADAIGSLELEMDVLVGEAKVALARDDLPAARAAVEGALQALDLVGAGLASAEAVYARAHRGVVVETALRVALADPRPRTLFPVLERVRAHVLAAAIGHRGGRGGAALDGEARALEEAARERVLRAQAACQTAFASGHRPTIRKATAAWEEARDAYRTSLQRLDRKASGTRRVVGTRPISLDEAQAALAKDEALVLYVLVSDAHGSAPGLAGALVVEAADARWVDLGEARWLRSAVADLAAAFRDGEDPGPPAAEVRRRLLDPLALPARVQRVRIVPDGPLGSVPFAWVAAQGEGARTFRDAGFVPSATVGALLRDVPRTESRRLLAVGAPDYGAGVGGAALRPYGGRPLLPLPAARDEIEAICREGDLRLLGSDASETNLGRVLGKGEAWRAIHLACHGLLDTRSPTMSALALTPTDEDDGFWTAVEIARLEVAADLVVLSACRSGLGRTVGAEGPVGLARAFLAAGVPCVLASLWDVDDDATAALMARFHEALRASGTSPAEALTQAQTAVRGEPGSRWHAPPYWAGWVLWGRGEG